MLPRKGKKVLTAIAAVNVCKQQMHGAVVEPINCMMMQLKNGLLVFNGGDEQRNT